MARNPTILYLEEQVAELRTALQESVRLQSHYAESLNRYDMGKRMTFDSANAWIERLRKTAQKEPQTPPGAT